MCDLGFVYRIARVAMGMPADAGGKSTLMQVTSPQAARRPLNLDEIAGLHTRLSESSEHLKRKVDMCTTGIVACVDMGRSDENVAKVISLVKERRGFQKTIASNAVMITNLESVRNAMATTTNNTDYTDVMARAGALLQRQNPDDAVEMVRDAMKSARTGIQAASDVSDAISEDISPQSNNPEEMSIEEEVKKIFADAEQRKMGAMLATAGMPPVSAIPPATRTGGNTSVPSSRPPPASGVLSISHMGAPMPVVVPTQLPLQPPGQPYSVPRPKNTGMAASAASRYTNV